MPAKIKDMSGQRFGKLVAIERADVARNGTTRWLCKCDCGRSHIVRRDSLISGDSWSCGCSPRHAGGQNKLPYGLASFHTLYAEYRRNAKYRSKEFDLTEVQFRNLTSSNCYYCGIKPSSKPKNNGYNGDYLYNGIDRIDNQQGYILGNVRPCCGRCNYLKGALSESDFYELVKSFGRIARHLGIE